RSDEQRSNDPRGAEAQPTFPRFFTRHHRPPCCERAESVAKNVLALMRERRCCGAATNGRGMAYAISGQREEAGRCAQRVEYGGIRMPLVLCLCPPVGRLRRAAGCGLDPAPRWHRGVDRRCALHLRATPREATVLVSPAHLLVRALGCGQHALVDRYRGDANA